MKNKLLLKSYMILIWLVIILFALTSATYAWFTISPDTKITPIEGKTGEGGANLLICETQGGEFRKTCALVPDSECDVLKPVSTADLNSFYRAKAQNSLGYSVLFENIGSGTYTQLIHGKVYLKSENKDCNVYFYREKLNFGGDEQVLASLRLGLKFNGRDGEKKYIFKLDDLANTQSAEKRQTVTAPNSVLSGISAAGGGIFTADKSQNLSEYWRYGDEDNPSAARNMLCVLRAEEICEVEYWLYLEGCDENCINSVQNKDVVMALAFAGAEIEN